ncbi:class I SAM-dependent methyltransferase [Patescibacteria group bacterium]|nr:class I SAM-dependent methyltransferase [Patescibacteria group bacterium]
MLTTLSPQEREAVSFYDRRIRAGDTVDKPLWADDFTYGMFRDHPDGPVVDIGCGIGRAIPALEAYGVRDYLGVDPSEASVTYCQATFPGLKFMISDVRLLGELYPMYFGGFLLLNVLMHTPEKDLDVVLSSLRKSLLPGASGLLNANKPAMAEYINDAAKSLTMSYYVPERLDEALKRHNFELDLFREEDVSFMMIVNAI